MATQVRYTGLKTITGSKNFYNFLFFQESPSGGSEDKSYIEQSMPAETILTLEVENSEIPVLFSQLIQNGQILDHPAVQQQQEVPNLEQDTYLNMVIQRSPTEASPSDPNAPMTSHHVLSPLAARASLLEQSTISGPIEVVINLNLKNN